MTTENQIEVNLELIKRSKIHIAMPCYGGMLTVANFTSFIKWVNTARQLGIDFTVETMTNESLISRARNTLTAKFLNQPDSTHLFFVDADIGWEPWHLLVLINHNVDLVGGLYPMKTLPVKWVINTLEGTTTQNNLLEVSKIGTGFMLIKREVFDVCAKHPSVKSYKNDTGLDPEIDKHLKTYFDCSVREDRYYSEDWQFCENFRDLGGKVYVDPRVMLTHTGTFTFSQENELKIFGDLEAVWLNKLKQSGVKLVDQHGNQILY